MKKIVFIMLMGIIALTSCKKDDQQSVNLLESKYFTVQNSVYRSGSLPGMNAAESMGTLSINAKAIPGGTSLASISSSSQIKEFYLGVEGVDGYLVVPANTLTNAVNSPMDVSVPSLVASNVANSNVYDILLLISQNLSQGFSLLIGGCNTDGTTFAPFMQTMEFLSVGTGALQVSLSFNNNTDVDLYVVRPNGEVIFYGNRGGNDIDPETGTETHWGLDLDSNPGCSIDGVNQENVFFPASQMLNGTYQVWVNLWSNCNDQATQWNIVATKNGTLINPTWGANPASGTFAADAPSNPIWSDPSSATKVMEFTITNGIAYAPAALSSKTASALIKEEMAKNVK